MLEPLVHCVVQALVWFRDPAQASVELGPGGLYDCSRCIGRAAIDNYVLVVRERLRRDRLKGLGEVRLALRHTVTTENSGWLVDSVTPLDFLFDASLLRHEQPVQRVRVRLRADATMMSECAPRPVKTRPSSAVHADGDLAQRVDAARDGLHA